MIHMSIVHEVPRKMLGLTYKYKKTGYFVRWC